MKFETMDEFIEEMGGEEKALDLLRGYFQAKHVEVPAPSERVYLISRSVKWEGAHPLGITKSIEGAKSLAKLAFDMIDADVYDWDEWADQGGDVWWMDVDGGYTSYTIYPFQVIES